MTSRRPFKGLHGSGNGNGNGKGSGSGNGNGGVVPAVAVAAAMLTERPLLPVKRKRDEVGAVYVEASAETPIAALPVSVPPPLSSRPNADKPDREGLKLFSKRQSNVKQFIPMRAASEGLTLPSDMTTGPAPRPH